MTQIEIWIDRIKMRMFPVLWVMDESARINRQRMAIQNHPYNLEPTTRVRAKPRTWYLKPEVTMGCELPDAGRLPRKRKKKGRDR